jgi:hypothetical protein
VHSHSGYSDIEFYTDRTWQTINGSREPVVLDAASDNTITMKVGASSETIYKTHPLNHYEPIDSNFSHHLWARFYTEHEFMIGYVKEGLAGDPSGSAILFGWFVTPTEIIGAFVSIIPDNCGVFALGVQTGNSVQEIIHLVLRMDSGKYVETKLNKKIDTEPALTVTVTKTEIQKQLDAISQETTSQTHTLSTNSQMYWDSDDTNAIGKTTWFSEFIFHYNSPNKLTMKGTWSDGTQPENALPKGAMMNINATSGASSLRLYTDTSYNASG